MSPSQFHDDQHARREINSIRPTPLKINKESHLIHKPTSSMSSSASSSLTATGNKQQRHPVIIYTHSPKIIHTHARDFMALVQKLTGLSRSDEPTPQTQGTDVGSGPSDSNNGPGMIGQDESMSSSIVTDENCAIGDVQSSTSITSVFDSPNPFFSDIPIFTPNSSDFFCSSRPFYRYPDSVFTTSNMGNSISTISPSLMEAMKAFPEY